MKTCYLVVLFVLFAPTMTYRLKKIKTIKMTTKQKCEKIKCPPIDDPVCVKIKNKHKKEVYIIAINKCEMKYASCHEDVEATIMPMVNCLHVVKKDSNITSKRNKRDVDERSGEDSANDSADGRLKIYYMGQHKGNSKLNYQTEDNGNEEPELLKGRSEESSTEERELLLKSQSDDNENEELLKGESKDSDNNDDELLKGQSEDKEDISADKVNADNVSDENQNQSVFEANKSENKLKNKSAMNEVDDNPKIEIEENDISKLISVDNVGPDYDQLHEKADLDENKKNCPTVCPSRDVMVCAKCRHNIHRTFLSTCHLRMFACKHTNEKLQLVKREPCVQSAPFISEFKETKGRIPESGELDEVHKFIFCRDKKLKDDPRCRFGTEDK